MHAVKVGRGEPATDLESRLRAVERITLLFRAERLVYLCFAITGFVMLLVCLLVTLLQHEQQAVASLGAFGSSGIVAFTSSRVLVMWNRALSVVAAESSQAGGE